MKHGIFIILLGVAFATLCFGGPVSVDPIPSEKEESVVPTPEEAPQATYLNTFSLRTEDQDLKLELYRANGEKIPATVYKHFQQGTITYETGHDVEKGLYVIKVLSSASVQYYKLMKIR
ncbi:MAG: hypothetical protein AAFR61_23180 [Bacteroidota bacterium]